MFQLEIKPLELNTNSIVVNGTEVAVVDDRHANLWRVINDVDAVFVSDDMAIMTEREPVILLRFRITQPVMEAFLKSVLYTYDGNTEGPLHLGWDEIDPSLRNTFRLNAEDIVESDCWEIDEGNTYPRNVPIIIIHPELVDGTNREAFIELYYVLMEVAA